MQKRVVNEIKEVCKPLSEKIFFPFVKAVWIFGSAIKKNKPTTDIDIFVLVDDTIKDYETLLKSLNFTLSRITEKADKKKLNLHIQKPMQLSFFWSLLIKGEPWAVTSVKNPIIIYDRSKYLPLIQKLLSGKKMVGADIKAERLVARSKNLLTHNRELRLEFVSELFNAAEEAVQIFLSSQGKIAFESKKLLAELKKLSPHAVSDIYFEMMILDEKQEKGTLSDFSGEELDYYTDKIRFFIKETEAILKSKNEKSKKP